MIFKPVYLRLHGVALFPRRIKGKSSFGHFYGFLTERAVFVRKIHCGAVGVVTPTAENIPVQFRYHVAERNRFSDEIFFVVYGRVATAVRVVHNGKFFVFLKHGK